MSSRIVESLYRVTLTEDLNRANEIKDAIDEIIKKCNIDLDTVHLLSYNDVRELEKKAYWIFREHDLDLSWDSEDIPGYDIHLAGNTDAMVNGLFRELKKKGWKEITPDELSNIKINRVYEEDKFGFPKPSFNANNIEILNKWSHHGYGSQASVVQTGTNVYVDKFNNILYDKYALVWD